MIQGLIHQLVPSPEFEYGRLCGEAFAGTVTSNPADVTCEGCAGIILAEHLVDLSWRPQETLAEDLYAWLEGRP